MFGTAAFGEIDPPLLKKAEAGDAEALIETGVACFNNGDYPCAAKWFEKGAKNGNVTAQYNLATMYVTGHEGFPKDYQKALDGFTAAAMKSHRAAQYNLGLMYLFGYATGKAEPVAGCAWVYLSGSVYTSGECSQNTTMDQKKKILDFIIERVVIDGVNGGAPALNEALNFATQSMTES